MQNTPLRSLHAITFNCSLYLWMPWELGYMDGEKGKSAILPVSQYKSSGDALATFR
jgi:hypothetical protein